MKVNKLEKAVIECLLADQELGLNRSTIDFGAMVIRNREFTGSGFLTDFEKTTELKLVDDEASLRWGKVGARLNDSRIETGYLIYFDEGYLVTLEGYTYGDEWPSKIDRIEMYPLFPSMNL